MALARELGYHHYHQRASNDALWANAILSRYPIVGASPNDLGVQVDVAGRKVVLFNIHATDYPYQPYQLLRIPYDDAPFLETADQAVDAARQARRTALALLRDDLRFAQDAELVLLTGDFNEPSWHDWTARTAAIGRHPLAVAWPFTAALEQLGFTDAFRAAYPDEVAHPGFTWSPLIEDGATDDHADRIDFVFLRGPSARVNSASVLGESGDRADIVVTPWPSDHRAVRANIEF
jgi:endonuclease/exonuclease/phosphatase family metal-dependent hydrolase